MEKKFVVGRAKRPITPPLGTPLYGYPKYVDEQDSVGGGEHGLGNDGGMIGAVSKGMDTGGIDLARHVIALGLLGENHGHVKGQSAQTGQANTGGLNGQDLGDVLVLEETVELLSESADEASIQLLVEERTDLEHVAVLNDTVLANAILHQFHSVCTCLFEFSETQVLRILNIISIIHDFVEKCKRKLSCQPTMFFVSIFIIRIIVPRIFFPVFRRLPLSSSLSQEKPSYCTKMRSPHASD